MTIAIYLIAAAVIVCGCLFYIMRVQGLSGAATTQALGLSRAAMKSRLHRGRETLRSQLTTPESTTGDGGVEDA